MEIHNGLLECQTVEGKDILIGFFHSKWIDGEMYIGQPYQPRRGLFSLDSMFGIIQNQLKHRSQPYRPTLHNPDLTLAYLTACLLPHVRLDVCPILENAIKQEYKAEYRRGFIWEMMNQTLDNLNGIIHATGEINTSKAKEAFNALRRKYALKNAIFVPEFDESMAQIKSTPDFTLELLANEQTLSLIRQAELSERERQVLLLTLEGKTNSDIAATISTSVGAVDGYRGTYKKKMFPLMNETYHEIKKFKKN